MVEAPEKIWAKNTPSQFFASDIEINNWPEYVRADLVTDKADAWDAVATKNAHIAALERQIAELRAALSTAPATADGWRPISEDQPAPPHDTPVLLWSPPRLSHNGEFEARPFSTGRSGAGWSEYSQHSHATHWMPLPAAPTATGGR